MSRTLLLGGARSGKSGLAEKQATASGRKVVVIVTAIPDMADAEMAARIARHQAQRPAGWRTREVGLQDLGVALADECMPGAMVVLDCLTVWLANQLFPRDYVWPEDGSYVLPDTWPVARESFLRAVTAVRGELILVSNEVGSGVVPMGAGNRAFVDEAGWLNQAVAEICERVVFVAAGVGLVMKGA